MKEVDDGRALTYLIASKGGGYISRPSLERESRSWHRISGLRRAALSISEGPGVLAGVCALTYVKIVAIHTKIYNLTVKGRQRYK